LHPFLCCFLAEALLDVAKVRQQVHYAGVGRGGT
jgi:hypothetical protein